MARQPDIQYIRYYTDGSAARKVAPLAPLKTLKLPKIRLKKRITLHIDPLAISGILMAAVMIRLMAVGIANLNAASQQLQTMESYVQTLTEENAQLSNAFHEGYDLEEIRTTALALGMVPKEQVQHITIRIPPEIVEEEPTSWERFYTFLTGLFA